MSYYRTPEHRRLRAQLIRKWKPWEKSTGPKTPEGKDRVSRNADKGGARQLLREVAKMLRELDKARRLCGGVSLADDLGENGKLPCFRKPEKEGQREK